MTDRVALVTGAARGQGAAIVARLREDGFRVAACDVRMDELRASVEALDDGVVAVSLDVTSEEQWKSAVADVVDRFGSLTTLVNNAGVLHRASLADETPAGFEGSWRFNCFGPFSWNSRRRSTSFRKPTGRPSSTPAAPVPSGHFRTTPHTAHPSGR